MASLESDQKSSMLREVPADGSVPDNHSDIAPQSLLPSKEPATFTITAHHRSVHLYTYPSREQHYPNSDLNRDILKNPSLGFADF